MGAAGAGVAFFACVFMALAGIRGWRRPPRTRPRGQSLAELLPTLSEGDEQHLRMAGIPTAYYALQRTGGLAGGLTVGVVLSLATNRGVVGAIVVTLLTSLVGWFLPLVGMRDTAKRARTEIDSVVRVWIALVAQQVAAGVDPTAAMLSAAQAGQRGSWLLLHRFLRAALQETKPAWTGLVNIVERYGVVSLSPVVSALGLAAERGTRLSDAILVAAETLWRDSMASEREKAARRAQVIVVPATGVALSLAVILVYPPFASLTGGVITPS
ncbi:type II secretion system F family protein [Candidatus Poriferisodalis sp.]|uniref:type II secretion system F family protein n=1 Tax=Candidatus Poriferisodalis sp. TaxID=3101277 RepID=UPI003B01C87F